MIIDILIATIVFALAVSVGAVFVFVTIDKSAKGIKTNKPIKPKIIIKTTNTNGIVVSDTTYVYKIK